MVYRRSREPCPCGFAELAGTATEGGDTTVDQRGAVALAEGGGLQGPSHIPESMGYRAGGILLKVGNKATER